MTRVVGRSAATVLICVLAGCGAGNRGGAGGRVFVRSVGEIVTTYELGDDGEILQSPTMDRYGVAVTRQYFYDERNELVSVSRENGATRAMTLFVLSETDQSRNRLARTTKTVVDSRGVSTEMDVQYFYTEDGKLDGMMQTDSYGNVQAKSADD